jgi:2-C-methyl-D-erythritol 4-phosphate cytidylyltransferase
MALSTRSSAWYALLARAKGKNAVMRELPKTALVMVAAGRSQRMQSAVPKVWLPLAGMTVVERALANFSDPWLNQRVLVLSVADLEAIQHDALGYLSGRHKLQADLLVAGGARRRDSVLSGVRALDPSIELVLIADGARPLTTGAVIQRVAQAVAEIGAAVPGIPLTDTVKRVQSTRVTETLDRSTLRAIQTPQGFRRARLLELLERTQADVTDEAALFEQAGDPVAVVEGDPDNLKITSPRDLALAQFLLSTRPNV